LAGFGVAFCIDLCSCCVLNFIWVKQEIGIAFLLNQAAETDLQHMMKDGRGLSDPQGRSIPDRIFVEMHLNTVRPECDRPESPYDDAEIRIGRGLKHPKGKGYAKFLAELGYDRNWAGMLAAMIVEEGRVRVATSQKKTEFAHALRRLANPRLDKEAFLANAKVVLDAMSGTHLTRGLFNGLPPFEGLSFIRALRFCVAGDMSERADACRIAAAIRCRVTISRGPKLTHASAAHQYFLETQSIFRPAAFTWSAVNEDFTDRLTQATREEFDDPDFNPVPAWRRLRAKRG
jgi:hypothetical protein